MDGLVGLPRQLLLNQLPNCELRTHMLHVGHKQAEVQAKVNRDEERR
jgi:hypothetical protein